MWESKSSEDVLEVVPAIEGSWPSARLISQPCTDKFTKPDVISQLVNSATVRATRGILCIAEPEACPEAEYSRASAKLDALIDQGRGMHVNISRSDLIHVFQYLGPSELARVGLVCTAWNCLNRPAVVYKYTATSKIRVSNAQNFIRDDFSKSSDRNPNMKLESNTLNIFSSTSSSLANGTPDSEPGPEISLKLTESTLSNLSLIHTENASDFAPDPDPNLVNGPNPILVPADVSHQGSIRLLDVTLENNFTLEDNPCSHIANRGSPVEEHNIDPAQYIGVDKVDETSFSDFEGEAQHAHALTGEDTATHNTTAHITMKMALNTAGAVSHVGAEGARVTVFAPPPAACTVDTKQWAVLDEDEKQDVFDRYPNVFQGVELSNKTRKATVTIRLSKRVSIKETDAESLVDKNVDIAVQLACSHNKERQLKKELEDLKDQLRKWPGAKVPIEDKGTVSVGKELAPTSRTTVRMDHYQWMRLDDKDQQELLSSRLVKRVERAATVTVRYNAHRYSALQAPARGRFLSVAFAHGDVDKGGEPGLELGLPIYEQRGHQKQLFDSQG